MSSVTPFVDDNSEKSTKESEKMKAVHEDFTSSEMNTSSKCLKNSHQGANAGVHPDIGPLPVGVEMSSLNGVYVSSGDVGNALQFTEFCSVFQKVLKLKRTQAEDTLKDIYQGRTRRPGTKTASVRFLIDMLSKIRKKKQGKDCKKPPASGEKYSWFSELKEFLSKSQSVLNGSGLGCLDDIADYENLNPSQKLRLLNVVCDEVLETESVYNWIEKQPEEVAKRRKEAKDKLATAKREKINLEKKIKSEIGEAIKAKNSAGLSTPERQAIVSRFMSEKTKAQAKVLDLTTIVEKYKREPDTARLEPIFQTHGYSYWKPNVYGKNDILCQTLGTGDDTLTLDEKWSTLNVEEEEVIEKHISDASRLKRKRKVSDVAHT